MSKLLWCEPPVISNLNANSTLADLFTSCMTFAVLPLVPMFLVTIALLTTFVSAYFYTNKPLNLWSSLTRLKLISSITTVVCSIFSLLIVLIFKNNKERQIYEVLNLMFFILSLLTHCLSLKFGYVTNGFLHLGWLMEVLSLVPVNFYLFADVSTSVNFINVILLLLGLTDIVCSFNQVILFYWPDNNQQVNGYQQLNEQPLSPFETSSTAQHAFQMYAGPLLRKSFKEKVSTDDFWQLEQSDKASDIQKITSTYTGLNNSTWDLTRLLIRCSWTHQLKALLNTLVTIVARYLYYVLLSSILEFATGDYPNWLAIFPVVALVINDFAKNLAIKQLNLHGNLAFYKVRTALASLIFDKMLRLSPSAQTNTATGIIINHINVDVGHSKNFWTAINEFVYCPSTVTISMILLNFQVGFHNMAYGLGTLVFFQITSLLLTRWTAHFTTVQMKYKDERLKLINDLLNGIKVLKLYGWEPSMQKVVSKIRQLEVMEIVKIEIIRTFIRMSYDIAPLIAILVTFYGYAIVDGNHLTPKSAFITIYLFDMIRYSIYRIPQLLANLVTTAISLRRVNRFLNEEERQERKVVPLDEGDEFVVEISKASFSWISSPINLNLSDINLNVRPGQLVAVIGQVASGKSTLLSGIVGELPPIFGDVQLRSSRIAYVPQQAWIQNMTLKENVLFDSDYNEKLYEQTLDACALRDDIELLPGGDLTEIGEKGINLSGGQKARVSLARAVYQQADLYILDDVLSAVDSHVGRQIFTNVIAHGGMLDGKTRIVAVNSTNYLDRFDLIVCLKDGKTTFCGSYNEYRALNAHLITPSTTSSTHSLKTSSTTESEEKEESLEVIKQKRLEPDLFIEAESFRTGQLSYGMYTDFIKEFGVIVFVLFALCLFVGSIATSTLSNLYMAKWSQNAMNMTTEESMHNLIIYGLYGSGTVLFTIVSFFFVVIGCYNASSSFHKQLMSSVLCAPMSFFDKTPLGRIINRFSMDIELLDNSICQLYRYLLKIVAESIIQFMSIFAAMPVMIPITFPLVLVCVFATRYFNAASAQFRRISSNSMSAVCSSVQDAYIGASSIRVFNAVQRFRNQFAHKLDKTSESNTVEIIANYWIQNRMDLFSNITILVILLVAIWFSNSGWITLGLLGMIVNSSVAIGGLFGETANKYRDCETELVCVERIKEYIMLENEPIWTDKIRAQPMDSSVEFSGVSLRYREQDAPVIHKVSFKVEAGQRVGIIGRTGAGKTSLTSLLFRLVEPFEGTIKVGNVNIKHLGPTLRRILTIIPQEPVLFCGSLRLNLDPFEEFEDDQLFSALNKAHLSNFVSSLSEGLNYEIADGGNNLSLGQRQLICLARALLRRSKILVLDEATSSVDPETDQLIQQTIRDNFVDCTVLTIAHRLNTVMDYDKILVMQAGSVIEYDTPLNLLQNEHSLFYSFAKVAGLC